jgi:hypothetical protein
MIIWIVSCNRILYPYIKKDDHPQYITFAVVGAADSNVISM